MHRKSTFLLAACLALLLAACAAPAPAPPPSPTSTPAGALIPYQSPTSGERTTPTPPGTSTPLPTSTPTPLTYKVKKGDDLGGIAFNFGVSVAALKTANPTVNPHFLSIGTLLEIPPGGSPPGSTATASAQQATPTSAPLATGAVNCYPGGDGGLWCFLLVHNDQSVGMENLMARITLLDTASQEQTDLDVSAPLDLLPPGKALPLAAYFPPPAPAAYVASGQLTLAMQQPPDDKRYLPVSVEAVQTLIDSDGRSARVTGQVSLPAGSAAARETWAVLVAYDGAGNVVGLRKWESSTSLGAGSSQPLDCTVYSLGGAIARVDVLAEAHP